MLYNLKTRKDVIFANHSPSTDTLFCCPASLQPLPLNHKFLQLRLLGNSNYLKTPGKSMYQVCRRIPNPVLTHVMPLPDRHTKFFHEEMNQLGPTEGFFQKLTVFLSCPFSVEHATGDLIQKRYFHFKVLSLQAKICGLTDESFCRWLTECDLR